MMFGQTVSGLLVDHFGFLGLPLKPLTGAKCCVAGIVLTGLVLVAVGTDEHEDVGRSRSGAGKALVTRDRADHHVIKNPTDCHAFYKG